MPKWNWNNRIAGPMLVALVLRISLAIVLQTRVGNDAFRDWDSESYESTAVNWIEGRGYTASDGRPMIYRTPGAPTLIAATYLLVGQRPVVVAIFQALLDCVTLIGVFMLTKSVTRSRLAATIASYLYACWPGAIVMSNQLMSETFFNAFLLLGLGMYARSQRCATGGQLLLLASGMIMGIGALGRPTLFYLFPILAVIDVARRFAERRQCMPSRQAALSAVALWCGVIAGFALVVSPWLVHNHRITGRFQITQLVPLKRANDAATLMAKLESISQAEAFARLGRQAGLNIDDGEGFKRQLKNDVWVLSHVSPAAGRYVRAHLAAYIAAQVQLLPSALFVPHTGRLFEMFDGYPARARSTTAPSAPRRTIIFIERLALAMLYSTSLCGVIWILTRPGKRVLAITLLLMIGALYAGFGLDALARYRLPIETLLIVFAAAPLAWLMRARQAA